MSNAGILQAVKDVSVATHLDTPKVMKGIRHAIIRTGFSENILDELKVKERQSCRRLFSY